MNWRNIICAVAMCIFFTFEAYAFDVPRKEVKLPPKLKQAIEKIEYQRYYVRPQPVKFEYGLAVQPKIKGWTAFEESYGKKWRLEVDARTNSPLLIEGKGIPWVPGKGNTLRGAAFGPGATREIKTYTLSDIAEAAQAFLAQNQTLLNVRKENLILDKKASTGFGKNNRYWTLRYQYVFKDPDLGIIPVRGSYIFFRINHGNLIQFGNQLAVSPGRIDTSGIITEQQAIRKALDLLGNPPDAKLLDAVRDIGQPDKSLQVVLFNEADSSLGHQLVRTVWIVTDTFSFEFWFDAHSGELVYVINRAYITDATVRGGIYPDTNTDPEVLRGMPFLDVNNNGVIKATNKSGIYDYDPPGSLATASLEGDYVRVIDSCGSNSISTSLSPGDISFGMGAGTDCITPGYGGPGNTHAARSSFFHVNQIKEKARRYLNDPVVTTPWLDNQLDVRVNRDDACTWECNACWNGVELQFVHSDSCDFDSDGTIDMTVSNTGETVGVFLHEFGHGLDDNTNGAPPEQGSGEAYGDIMAFLQTHESCIGDNFQPGVACQYGCGAACTGVRDVDVAPDISPANIDAAPADCDRWACPYYSGFWPYQGPMGYEGHCESLIASGAVWDMIQGFIGRFGDGAGWALGDRIWYESLNQTGSAYQVVTGGQCNTAATVDGCGADNWYKVFLSLDDDNGDLTDGTPNAGIIWNAFNDHGIACGAAAPAESTTCPAIATPAMTAVPTTGQVQLDWTDVVNAATYRVYRNELGCNQGFTPIADITAPSTSLTDTTINNGTTYYYAVQAIGTDDICVSAFSACIDATPTAPLQAANIFMVLDQSGSMSGATDVSGEQKIDALKDAGSMILDVVDDYAGDGFRIGAVSFSSTVTGDTGGVRDPSDMLPGGDREVLNNFITALTPTNLTAIGQGINSAVSGFPTPDDGNQKVVMLLSDGMQNVPPNLELNTPPPGVAVGGTPLPPDIRFYSIALGTQIQEDLFDDLATQGGIPGFYYKGGTAEIQGNFSFWVADVLGLDPSGAPFAPGTGSGFTAQPATASSSSDSSNATTFIINHTARRVTFLVTWQEKGRDLRFYLDTPVGRVDPPASSFHPAQGYASYTIRLPIKGYGSADHVGQWVLRMYEPTASAGATAHSPMPPFNDYALFDDPAISLKYVAGGDDPGAGETLPLEVTVLENGNPVSDLDVKIIFEGPETGLGELLSQAKIDDPKKLSAVQPGIGDRFPDNATRKLAFLLEKDPNFLRMLPGNVISLNEVSHGVYRGNIPAERTVAAGTYTFTFEVSGKGILNDSFTRIQRFSRYLRLKPTVKETVIEAEIIKEDDLHTARFLVIPRDRAKKRLGPGWVNYIKPSSKAGSLVGPVLDNLDGSYTVNLAVEPGQTGEIMIDVLGTKIKKSIPQPRRTWWWLWIFLILIVIFLVIMFRSKQS